MLSSKHLKNTLLAPLGILDVMSRLSTVSMGFFFIGESLLGKHLHGWKKVVENKVQRGEWQEKGGRKKKKGLQEKGW